MLAMEKREREGERAYSKGKKTTNIQDWCIFGKVWNGGGDDWRGWATGQKGNEENKIMLSAGLFLVICMFHLIRIF